MPTPEELKAQQEKEKEMQAQAEAQAKADAGKAGKPVTQEAIDAIYKKLKETEEKLTKSEQEKVGLVTRVVALETGGKPKGTQTLKDIYNEENMPQTEEDWDELIAQYPTYGTDLRRKYQDGEKSFRDAQSNSAKRLRDKHPDMFMKDKDGNFIFNERGIVFNPESEKAKVFQEIANKDPRILEIADGPEMVMALMEKRLQGQEEGALKEKIEQEKDVKEKQRQADIKAGRVADGGSPPPAKPAVEVKFNSEAEKQAAERAVASGKVKDLATYCAIRDNKDVAYGRGGF